MDANTRLIDMTLGDLLAVIHNEIKREEEPNNTTIIEGVDGLAELFDCSSRTALRILRSGIIDEAVTKVGKRIFVDSKKAIDCFNRKK